MNVKWNEAILRYGFYSLAIPIQSSSLVNVYVNDCLILLPNTSSAEITLAGSTPLTLVGSPLPPKSACHPDIDTISLNSTIDSLFVRRDGMSRKRNFALMNWVRSLTSFSNVPRHVPAFRATISPGNVFFSEEKVGWPIRVSVNSSTLMVCIQRHYRRHRSLLQRQYNIKRIWFFHR